MDIMPAPHGAIKVKLNVNSNHHAYGRLSVGQVLNVDEVTGNRWIAAGIACRAPEVPAQEFTATTADELAAATGKPRRGRKPKGS